MPNNEQSRINDHYANKKNWLRWGPYLSERQWGTVREDYSADGDAWNYFPHDHARSRAYRWGEDGIAGISDDGQRLCFAMAFWNGRDPYLKERLFGLANEEGNHGEDVKEMYFYLDNTPTHAYMAHRYLYPCGEFPYQELLETNQQRTRLESEFELTDTAVWGENGWFDILTEYAKVDTEDLCVRITATNKSQSEQQLWLLPTLWFRNTWLLGADRPNIQATANGVEAIHPNLGKVRLYFEKPERLLFTENDTNEERIFGAKNETPFVKDAFHRAVCGQDFDFIKDKKQGTKCAPVYHFTLKPGESASVRLRLANADLPGALDPAFFTDIFKKRKKEADEFYNKLPVPAVCPLLGKDCPLIRRQAFAGLLWGKQFYNYNVADWLDGDPQEPAPPPGHQTIRNTDWRHLNARDIISMPDKWEYPWFAGWDLAFQCIPLAAVDPGFAKNQLLLLLKEWYMHPNGKVPGYEWQFDHANPPIHPWAALEVYHLEETMTGKGDRLFLEKVFHKLLLNFTWWVNRVDADGNNVFEGGFLGLDNIALFDREKGIPEGCTLDQADGTAWMAFYCLHMLEISLTLATENPAYEDMATKFFEHFVLIADSLNSLGNELWDQEDGFFYDQLRYGDKKMPLKVRSLVGLSTLFGVTVLKKSQLEKVPGFTERMHYFHEERIKRHGTIVFEQTSINGDILLSLVPPDRLQHLLKVLFDEGEFLSPNGIRSVSKYHQEHPVEVQIDGQTFGLHYEPAEGETAAFGGNSNWRGPVWFPMNYLLIHALETYQEYYGDTVKMEFPTGSGTQFTFGEAAGEIAFRLLALFERNADGERKANGGNPLFLLPEYQELMLFYEYYHGETGKGLGASHQTGWTGLAAVI
ncbi:MAG: glucosidase [Lewinellaceae bacterium]|nr:glucosidase [Saprospiraceae bacterium]MCB9341943.1 glucosidase [Lewinellaceae bacterium]